MNEETMSTESTVEKSPSIEVTITEMAKEKLLTNGRCCITVKHIARDAAREHGILEKYGRLDNDVYLSAEKILRNLGGIPWSGSQPKFSRGNVYSFNVDTESVDSAPRSSEAMFKAPRENESTEVHATKLAMMLAIQLKECYNSEEPSAYSLGKTLIESLAGIYGLEVVSE